MSYKTILVHVSPSPHCARRTELALGLAAAFEAHLVGAAMNGVPHIIYEGNSMEAALQLAGAQMNAMAAQAGAALEAFERQCVQFGLASFERRQLNDDDLNGLILQSRYADLLVLGQPDPDETRFTLDGDLPATVALNSARPLLVVPYAPSAPSAQTAALPGRVLIGWDGGAAATRAITAALPLLQRARAVTLAVINPDRAWNGHGEEPGADMALFLARHGVKVEVAVRSTRGDPGATLLTMASDLGAELLVLGAYGHSRFRELVLGGASATVLEAMTVPVLLAH
jgi:nucleotide-binding universal stress UspA family protein